MLPKNKFFSIIIILLLYFSALASFNDSLNVIALYVALPIAFLISFMQELKIKVNVYLGILLLLYLWVLFTTLFSVNIDISIGQLKQILGCILLCYVLSTQVKNPKLVIWLYLVYVVLYISTMEYAVNNIMSTMIELGGRERVNDDKLNANTIAYFTFFLTFVVFILGEILKSYKLKRIFQLLFFATIPLSFWVAIITASRQVLILQVPLILVLLYLRYVKYGGVKSKFFIITVFVILFIYSAGYVINEYEGSFLAKRSEVAITDDNRFLLVKESIEIGLNNLFVGVGPACVKFFTTEKAFAHNTFLELFAGTGIVGMIIYIRLIWVYFSNQIRRYKYTKDKMFMYFIIFGCFYLLDQIFFSFYNSLWLIGFFILVASHSEMYYNVKDQKIIKTR